MMSLIEVKCPHCGTRGQIMLPPLGALVIGPCPECHEMVVVFCGRALALDRQTMTEGTQTERAEHLLGVLTTFLEKRVEQLLEQADEPSEASEDARGPHAEPVARTPNDEDLLDDEDDLPFPVLDHEAPAPVSREEPRLTAMNRISQEEVDDFVHVDLKLLDNPDYFRAIFE